VGKGRYRWPCAYRLVAEVRGSAYCAQHCRAAAQRSPPCARPPTWPPEYRDSRRRSPGAPGTARLLPAAPPPSPPKEWSRGTYLGREGVQKSGPLARNRPGGLKR
jgi:hypothetical protein